MEASEQGARGGAREPESSRIILVLNILIIIIIRLILVLFLFLFLFRIVGITIKKKSARPARIVSVLFEQS